MYIKKLFIKIVRRSNEATVGFERNLNRTPCVMNTVQLVEQEPFRRLPCFLP